MDVSYYEGKISDMLNNERTYEQLTSDPTSKYKRELVAILTRLYKEDKITNKQYDLLYPTAENILRIYGMPKIHKPGNKVRPIVDYTGTIGYQIYLNSKNLAEDLARGFHWRGGNFQLPRCCIVVHKYSDRQVACNITMLLTGTMLKSLVRSVMRASGEFVNLCGSEGEYHRLWTETMGTFLKSHLWSFSDW